MCQNKVEQSFHISKEKFLDSKIILQNSFQTCFQSTLLSKYFLFIYKSTYILLTCRNQKGVRGKVDQLEQRVTLA